MSYGKFISSADRNEVKNTRRPKRVKSIQSFERALYLRSQARRSVSVSTERIIYLAGATKDLRDFRLRYSAIPSWYTSFPVNKTALVSNAIDKEQNIDRAFERCKRNLNALRDRGISNDALLPHANAICAAVVQRDLAGLEQANLDLCRIHQDLDHRDELADQSDLRHGG